MSKKRESKKLEQVIAKWLVTIGIVIVVFGLFSGIHSCQEKEKAEAKAKANPKLCQNEAKDWVKIPDGFYRGGNGVCVEGTPPAPPAPPKVSGVTPTEITANYGFFLEADAPIMVQYPGEKAFLFKPGGPCNQAPQPKNSGPKKFWDPKDPKNGHIHFRLYRGSGKC